MPPDDNRLLDLIYGGDGARRYTQDSPVMPATLSGALGSAFGGFGAAVATADQLR